MKHFRLNDGPQQLKAKNLNQVRPLKSAHGPIWNQQQPRQRKRKSKRPEAGGGVENGAIDTIQADIPRLY